MLHVTLCADLCGAALSPLVNTQEKYTGSYGKSPLKESSFVCFDQNVTHFGVLYEPFMLWS